MNHPSLVGACLRRRTSARVCALPRADSECFEHYARARVRAIEHGGCVACCFAPRFGWPPSPVRMNARAAASGAGLHIRMARARRPAKRRVALRGRARARREPCVQPAVARAQARHSTPVPRSRCRHDCVQRRSALCAGRTAAPVCKGPMHHATRIAPRAALSCAMPSRTCAHSAEMASAESPSFTSASPHSRTESRTSRAAITSGRVTRVGGAATAANPSARTVG